MRANRLALLVLFAGAAALAGCDKARPVAPAADVATSCLGCHGGLDNDTGAPPRDTHGGIATTLISVGAHSAHIAAGLDCNACHVKPGRIEDPGHINGTAAVVFSAGSVAAQPGVFPNAPAPSFNPATGTCSNVYCHGSKLPVTAQGQATTPVWTGNPPSLAGAPCGSCHGSAATNGAPGGHATNLAPTACANCHPSTVNADGTLIPAAQGGLHMDGHVDVSGGACTSCHGNTGRGETDALAAAAPPQDSSGATTGAKVGAHLRHVSTLAALGSRLSKPFGCTECHVVPNAVPHNTPANLVVQFGTAAGTIAKTGGLTPSYTTATGTCASTYCHGTSLAGGTAKTPSWTGTAACGTCHFQASTIATSGAGHPKVDKSSVAITTNAQCSQCHPGTVKADGTIDLALGNHVNGTLEVTSPHAAGWVASTVHGPAAKLDLASCTVCHGATFGTDVGAGKSCNACHANPAAFGQPGATHANWQNECTFCHGDSSRPNVAVQDTLASTPAINAAKAAPPVGSQDETAAGSNAVGAHLVHVQGLSFSNGFKCQQCHGTTIPPPVAGSALPASLQHVNGGVVIGWQLATLSGTVTATPAAGSIVRATPVTCANYCHGSTLSGGANTTVSWTGAGSVACGACHSLPPTYAAPSWHVSNSAASTCATCHYAGLDKAKHVNGVVDLTATITCHSCHGSATNDAPPGAASAQATTNSDPRVGAHQAHVTAGALARAFACTDCHGTLPTAMNHSDGKVTLGWSALVTTGGTAATPVAGSATSPGTTTTCANYCHGGQWAPAGATNDQYRGSHTSPTWTAGVGEVSCGSCHQAPPTSSAHAAVGPTKNCGDCHTGYNCTSGNLAGCTVNLTSHVNGALDVSGQTCSSCHGTAGRTMAAGTNGPAQLNANNIIAVPPADALGAASSNHVGPHLAHAVPSPAGQVYKPVLCSECHTTAVDTYTAAHSNGIINVAFTNATGANLGGIVPSWVPGVGTGPGTCVTYCHGASLSAGQKGQITTWRWDTVTVAACNSCHGTAPNDFVHTSVSKTAATTACNPCHGTVVNAAGAIIWNGTGAAATTLHMNGVRNPTTTCHSCHGSATNDAPPVATNGTSTGVKVGAHQRHVTATTLRAAVLACTECHPNNTTQNHASGIVDLPYNTLAKTGGLVPTPANLGPATVPTQATWEAAPTCTNYCHGQKWIGNVTYAGSRTSPAWTDTAAVAAACGSCHLAPPTSSAHASVTATKNCGDCHTGYNCTTGNLAGCTVNKTVHINGGADVSGQTCSSCHGTAGRTLAGATLGPVQVNANNVIAFPPADTAGATTGTKVGAHAGHVNPAAPGPQIYKPVLCSECHTTAVDTYTTAHPNGVSNVAFTNATGANLGGVIPSWTAGAPSTCVTYCHGASLTAGQKGTITTWQWNTGITAACNSCHGTAPNDPVHTSVSKTAPVTACNPCHSTVVSAAGAIIFTGTGTAATTLHMNGVRNPTTTCHSCHGSATNDAPPVATNGTSTGVKVGAHQKHVTATTLRSAVLACADCHVLNTTQNHASGVVDLPYGTLAKTGGLVPTPSNLGPATVPTQATWEAAPNCTNYCHGQKWIGNATYAGSRTSPAWTDTAAVAAACGSCHLAPPSSSAHASVTATKNCGDCHTGYSCTTGNLAGCTVNKTVHINGVADVSGQTCSSCHGTAGRTMAANTLGPVQVNANNLIAVPPLDTGGATTGTKVGPHQAHINPNAPGPQMYRPVLCSECHTTAVDTYTTAHPNGVTNVAFTNATGANLGGVVPSWTAGAPSTCVTYCHGASFTAAQKGTITTWQWNTGITVACNSCHGLPPDPAGTHAGVAANATACNACHAATVSPTGTIVWTGTGTAATTTHINGSLEGGESNGNDKCWSCHTDDVAGKGTRYQQMQADTTVYHHVLTADNNTAGTPAVTTYPTTATAKTCASCHADHNVFVPTINTANTTGRGANLRVSGLASAPPAVADGTNPNQAPGTTYTNTDYTGTAGLCVSCHASAQTKSTTAQKSTGETTTKVVNGTNFSTSTHQFTVAGQITSGGSPILANCMKCHSDAPVGATYPEKQNGTFKFALHTSVDRRHRNPLGMTAPADNMEEKFCFRCHHATTDVNPGGGPAKAVANRDYTNSATMSANSQGIFLAFTAATHTAKHNITAYSGVHQPTEDQARISANKHVECEDCHNPHAARSGAKAATNQNTVWGPLTGVTGVSVTFSGTNWTAPTAYAAVDPATLEYQICFKCHSGANTALATWNANWTNLALEFSTGNQSRHPVAAALPPADPGANGSSQLAAKQLINGWAPGMVMTCSDCHGADAAAPAAQGPHGSAVTFMLKGTNRAWPYTTAGANSGTLFAMNNTGTGNGTANGLFCRNCHGDPAGASTVTNLGHVEFKGQHQFDAISACVGCHIRVPHGGKVSRLILTSAAPARYQVAGQTPNLVRFIKNNTGAYSGNSWFGSSCGEHSGGAAGGEAW